jgi:hypothetical protein
MQSPATIIAERLAENAESVCRRYLPNGHREGRYWLVGDVHNTPGRSLYVRLAASPDGRGQAGKWTDAQSGDHGDLLDIIAITRNCRTMRETLDEARHFRRRPAHGKQRSGSGQRRSQSPEAPSPPISHSGKSSTSPAARRSDFTATAGIARRRMMHPIRVPHGRR